MPTLRGATIVGLASSLVVATSEGQTRDQGLVSWHIHVYEMPVQGNYRTYAERESLELALFVDNKSASRVQLDQARLRDVLSLRLFDGASQLSASLRWLPEVRLSDDKPDDPARSDLAATIVLEPNSRAQWALRLQRGDGLSYTAGEYRMAFTTKDFGSAVRATSGERWEGRAPDGNLTVSLSVTPPTNARERSIMHMMNARDALRRQVPPEALEQYELAVAAERNMDALVGLASVYISSHRYREAVSILEESVKQFSSNASAVTKLSQQLAFAHVAAGDESSAARVLRAAGASEADVSRKLDEMRTVNASRQP